MKFLIIFSLTCFPFILKAQDASCLLFKIEGKESAYPRLSKDDKKILYQSNAQGNWQLMILDIASKSQSHVMRDVYNNNFPDWSPDNSMIAFTSDRDGNEEIYVMKSDGSDLKRITFDPARDIHPYFSPDGKYLLFNSTRGNSSFDVYRYELKTGNLLRVTETTANETCARYSPDMKAIAFLKNDHTEDDVYILNTKSNILTNLTNTPSIRDGWPMFSDDNDWVYYSSLETGLFSIYRIKRDGTHKQKLTSPGPGEEDARVYISHDHKWFVYNKRTGNTIEIRSSSV